jgi:hypothetical protein
MTNINKDNELIKLLEYESNPNKENRITCPKCSHDTVIKKDYQVDLPKTVGFVFFLGASMAIVIMINAIVMIREKMKIKKLPSEIKKKLEEENDKKMSLMGLHMPTKMKISCNKCDYIFYENYNSGDMIIVFVFFILIISIIFIILFVFLR